MLLKLPQRCLPFLATDLNDVLGRERIDSTRSELSADRGSRIVGSYNAEVEGVVAGWWREELSAFNLRFDNTFVDAGDSFFGPLPCITLRAR